MASTTLSTLGTIFNNKIKGRQLSVWTYSPGLKFYRFLLILIKSVDLTAMKQTILQPVIQ